MALWRMSASATFLLTIFVLPYVSFAQITCNGVLKSPDVIKTDVRVYDKCTLIGVNVTGSVHVSKRGRLTTVGNVAIFGSVSGEDSGNIYLGGYTKVSGDVSLYHSPKATLTLGSHSSAGKVSIEGPSKFVGWGKMGGFGGKGSGDAEFHGAHVSGGGILLEGGNATLTLCGSKISGGIKIGGVEGDFRAVKGKDCKANTIEGELSVEKGIGEIDIIGNSLVSGDLKVVEQDGDIVIRHGALGDVSVEKVSGTITFDHFLAESDVGISLSDGSLIVKDSKFTGDISLEVSEGNVHLSNTEFDSDVFISEAKGRIYIADNKFHAAVLDISRSTGGIQILGNKDFSTSLIENRNVTFARNEAIRMEILKNVGGVSITNNTMKTIFCIDNMPKPVGINNTVAGSSGGQCAGF